MEISSRGLQGSLERAEELSLGNAELSPGKHKLQL